MKQATDIARKIVDKIHWDIMAIHDEETRDEIAGIIAKAIERDRKSRQPRKLPVMK